MTQQNLLLLVPMRNRKEKMCEHNKEGNDSKDTYIYFCLAKWYLSN